MRKSKAAMLEKLNFYKLQILQRGSILEGAAELGVLIKSCRRLEKSKWQSPKRKIQHHP